MPSSNCWYLLWFASEVGFYTGGYKIFFLRLTFFIVLNFFFFFKFGLPLLKVQLFSFLLHFDSLRYHFFGARKRAPKKTFVTEKNDNFRNEITEILRTISDSLYSLLLGLNTKFYISIDRQFTLLFYAVFKNFISDFVWEWGGILYGRV